MNTTQKSRRFLLLQINDALFPIGAYSHSYGLETYIQKNLVNNSEQAWKFIQNRMLYGFCNNEFLTVKLAYSYTIHNQLNKLLELEEILEASRAPKEIREAGKKLGSRFVKTVLPWDVEYKNDIFHQYISARKKKTTVHAVVYGVFCASSGIPYEDAMVNYLYAQTSSMVTNCVKSIPLSQTDGQKMLFMSHGLLEQVMEKLEKLDEDDLCLSTPGFDIRSMQHESLYSRIYMS